MFFVFNDPFSDRRDLFLSSCSIGFKKIQGRAKKKGAFGRRLREDNSHLSKQSFHNITEPM